MKSTPTILIGSMILGVAVWTGWRVINHKENRPFVLPTTTTVDSQRRSILPTALLTGDKEARIQAARSLPSQITPEALKEIEEFLTNPPQTDNRESWYLTLNEVMETLRKREDVPAGFPDLLSRLANTETTDPVVADYCIQHLILLADSGLEQSTDTQQSSTTIDDAAERMYHQVITAAQQPFWQDQTLPGTVLQSVASVGNRLPTEVRSELEALTTEIIEGRFEASRITQSSAIQAASLLGMAHLTPRVRHIATDQNQAADLRLVSVAALGTLGSSEDLDSLNELATQSMFKYAAQEAIKKISRP
jgi:hypothetical protein